jgi:hypothetical protein
MFAGFIHSEVLLGQCQGRDVAVNAATSKLRQKWEKTYQPFRLQHAYMVGLKHFLTQNVFLFRHGGPIQAVGGIKLGGLVHTCKERGSKFLSQQHVGLH